MVDPATILHTFQKSNGTLSDSPSPSPRRRFFNSAAQNVTWNTTSGPHTGASNAPTPSTSNAATIHSDAVAVSTTPSIISRVRIALSDIKQHLLHSLPLSADKSQSMSELLSVVFSAFSTELERMKFAQTPIDDALATDAFYIVSGICFKQPNLIDASLAITIFACWAHIILPSSVPSSPTASASASTPSDHAMSNNGHLQCEALKMMSRFLYGYAVFLPITSVDALVRFLLPIIKGSTPHSTEHALEIRRQACTCVGHLSLYTSQPLSSTSNTIAYDLAVSKHVPALFDAVLLTATQIVRQHNKHDTHVSKVLNTCIRALHQIMSDPRLLNATGVLKQPNSQPPPQQQQQQQQHLISLSRTHIHAQVPAVLTLCMKTSNWGTSSISAQANSVTAAGNSATTWFNESDSECSDAESVNSSFTSNGISHALFIAEQVRLGALGLVLQLSARQNHGGSGSANGAAIGSNALKSSNMSSIVQKSLHLLLPAESKYVNDGSLSSSSRPNPSSFHLFPVVCCPAASNSNLMSFLVHDPSPKVRCAAALTLSAILEESSFSKWTGPLELPTSQPNSRQIDKTSVSARFIGTLQALYLSLFNALQQEFQLNSTNDELSSMAPAALRHIATIIKCLATLVTHTPQQHLVQSSTFMALWMRATHWSFRLLQLSAQAAASFDASDSAFAFLRQSLYVLTLAVFSSRTTLAPISDLLITHSSINIETPTTSNSDISCWCESVLSHAQQLLTSMSESDLIDFTKPMLAFSHAITLHSPNVFTIITKLAKLYRPALASMWTPLFATSATLCMSHSHSTKFSLSNLLAAALGSNEPHLVIEALKVIEEWSDMKQSEENDDESSPLAVRSLSPFDFFALPGALELCFASFPHLFQHSFSLGVVPTTNQSSKSDQSVSTEKSNKNTPPASPRRTSSLKQASSNQSAAEANNSQTILSALSVIRVKIVAILGQMPHEAIDSLNTELRSQLITMLFRACHDTQPPVRAAAARALSSHSLYAALSNSATLFACCPLVTSTSSTFDKLITHLLNLSFATPTSLDFISGVEPVLNVRAKAVWALANVSSMSLGDKSNDSNCDGVESKLSQALLHLAAENANEKILSNAVRGLGYLSRSLRLSINSFNSPQWLQWNLIVNHLSALVTSASLTPRSRWNAVYALGSALTNSVVVQHQDQLYPFHSTVGSGVRALLHVITSNTDNFKVLSNCISALSSLIASVSVPQTITSRLVFGVWSASQDSTSSVSDNGDMVFKSVCSALVTALATLSNQSSQSSQSRDGLELTSLSSLREHLHSSILHTMSWLLPAVDLQPLPIDLAANSVDSLLPLFCKHIALLASLLRSAPQASSLLRIQSSVLQSYKFIDDLRIQGRLPAECERSLHDQWTLLHPVEHRQVPLSPGNHDEELVSASRKEIERRRRSNGAFSSPQKERAEFETIISNQQWTAVELFEQLMLNNNDYE